MTNDQSMTKPQCPKLDQNSRRGRRERRLVIGHWAFFGHWSLVIGHYGHRQNARLNSTAVHPVPLPRGLTVSHILFAGHRGFRQILQKTDDSESTFSPL